MIYRIFCCVGVFCGATNENAQDSGVAAFYLPENAAYTIVDSARDSVRFTIEKTLTHCDKGHLASKSSFVNPEGEVMGWHDFGYIEGPGWAANAIGGAYEIYRLGAFCNQKEWQTKALGILDHVLDHGFIDDETGLIRGYRDTQTQKTYLNYRHNSDWFCPGSMAKNGYQLLIFADELGNDPRAERMRMAALRCASWIDDHLDTAPNGWFPRRCTPEGAAYNMTPEGKQDAFYQTSADGLFILQLQAALSQRGLADYREQLAKKTRVFMEAGGFFGSINHDTYDPRECVSYSVAFRTLRLIAKVLGDDAARKFAYETCLPGLEHFKMREDRNGVATTGLLYMEDSWDTAYLWENAEAALAYLEAAADLRENSPEKSRRFEMDGLVILRAISHHHYGPHGFLTEGVDWNNHVGQQHHIGQSEFGAIRYTEPFLNNQHIVEPTLYYLENLARHERDGDGERWLDCEGNTVSRKKPKTE